MKTKPKMNIGKILTFLALMLCCIIPMMILSVAAAPGDVVVDLDFDDGSNGGFSRTYGENGFVFSETE